jgi:hypothetical protein
VRNTPVDYGIFLSTALFNTLAHPLTPRSVDHPKLVGWHAAWPSPNVF